MNDAFAHIYRKGPFLFQHFLEDLKAVSLGCRDPFSHEIYRFSVEKLKEIATNIDELQEVLNKTGLSTVVLWHGSANVFVTISEKQNGVFSERYCLEVLRGGELTSVGSAIEQRFDDLALQGLGCGLVIDLHGKTEDEDWEILFLKKSAPIGCIPDIVSVPKERAKDMGDLWNRAITIDKPPGFITFKSITDESQASFERRD